MNHELGRDPDNGLPDAAEFIIADEEAFCELDARLRYSEITVEDGAGLTGRLSLVSIDDPNAFSLGYREQLGTSSVTRSPLLIGGGLAQFRAGVWTRTKDQLGRAEIVSAMARKALGHARSNGSHPISLFVADPDLAAFQVATDVMPRSQPRYMWCTLKLTGARGLDEFFDGQDRKIRQTWRRDQRDAERLGLVHEVVGFDDAITRAAAPLIADVSRRNGLAEPHQLTRWRLAGYKHRPGQSSYIRVSDDHRVVAYTACRTWGTTLQAHTVGIDPTVTDRRSVYHYAAYLAPLAVALAANQSHVEYGIAHEQPKLARGCVPVTVWQVDFDSG